MAVQSLRKTNFVLTAIFIAIIAQESHCLHNKAFSLSMNAHEIIANFGEQAQFLNDIDPEDYTLLSSISSNVYNNATFWNLVKTSFLELGNSNNLMNTVNGNSSKNNSQCIADTLKFMTDVMQLKLYTIQWMDAVGKLPSGLLQGHFAWFGDYQTCMDTKQDDDSFHGKYCISSLYVTSFAEYFKTKTPIDVGFCVPHSCDNDTVMDLVRMAMRFSPVQIYPLTTACSEPMPYVKGDIAASVILSLIAFFVLLGTMVDIYHRISDDNEQGYTQVVKSIRSTNRDPSDYVHEDSRSHSDTADLVENEILDSGLISPRAFEDRSMEISQEVSTVFVRLKGGLVRVFLAMSLITNAEKLLDTSRRSQELSALNGIRVISISWVILGHSYVFILNLIDNPLQLLKLPKRFLFQPILNGTYSVDSFFFLSGLLVAYLTLRELQRRDGKLNWLMFYFHRFWRLTPAYMMCLMFFVTLYKHTIEGPIGPFIAQSLKANSCYTYWWTNLLYINNFIPDFANSCMAWSWYLANDMQFFVVSPLFIILLYRYPKFGLGAVFVAICGSVTLTSLTAYHENMKVLLTSQKANVTTADTGDIYEKPYHRISPYLVGIATGYLIFLHKGHLRLPKIVVALGWFIAVAIGMSVIYGLYWNYKDDREPSGGVAAFYIGIGRFSWSLALSWLAFACVCGYGGPVNKILSWSLWGPLGRLTYSVYLVHPMVMYWYLFNQQKLLHLTDINMAYLFTANIVISYLVAFVVSLFLEAPMIQLEKIVFNRQ